MFRITLKHSMNQFYYVIILTGTKKGLQPILFNYKLYVFVSHVDSYEINILLNLKFVYQELKLVVPK